MLPRRQLSAARARSPHATRMSVRQAILAALAVVFVLGLYMNFQFLAQSSSSSPRGGASATASAGKKQQKQLAKQLAFETREVKHIAFTSGCSELDFVHAEVLAHSLRATGYKHNVTHLVYGCSHGAFEDLQRRKNAAHGVEHVGFPAVKEPKTLFGEGLTTTTLQLPVVQQWFSQELNRNRLKDDDFVMLVESDAIFTKKPDIWNLFREVEDIEEPRWFGQDAAWYWPKRLPLPEDALAKVVPSGSPALKIMDWRDFAATGPYVVEVALLREVLPTVVSMFAKLDAVSRHLAFPLAAAHHGLAIGISGALNVHHYPSRYENWDFVDDVKSNPCNESALRAPNVEMLSFPITVRAQNFTLPQWRDGRQWSFFDDQIPRDFFHCDAWLFQEPSGELWHLASTTKGYEQTPTILRRRHTMSVCMVLQAYNAAASAYKKAHCAQGFNANKAIPMVQGATWASAVAYAAGGEGAKVEVPHYGDVARAESVAETRRALPGQAASDDVHFVFATGCSPDEHWQSDLLAQSFSDVGQRGRLSRVVAGCSDAELQRVMARTRAAYPFLQLFSTKSHTTAGAAPGDAYAAFNRPFGLRDWLRGANPPVLESVVVILHADFVFARPLTVNSGHRVTTSSNVDSHNYKNHSEVVLGLRVYKPFFVYHGQRLLSQVSDAVASGAALAQKWSVAGGLEAKLPQLCPECGAVAEADLREYYLASPPVVLARSDLAAMVDDYCSLAVKARALDAASPTAEMVGFAVAAVKHKLKFTTFNNLAVSGGAASESDEYWGFLDFVKRNPCDETTDVPAIVAEAPRGLSGAASYRAKDKATGLEWVYDRALVPANVFACDAWLLALPPKSLWTEAKKANDRLQLKQAFGVCTSIKLLNAAVVRQRQRVCSGGFNGNRKLRLVAPRPSDALKVGAVETAWAEAATNAGGR